MIMTIKNKKRNSHTIAQRDKMTKSSFLYCLNRTGQLQIQPPFATVWCRFTSRRRQPERSRLLRRWVIDVPAASAAAAEERRYLHHNPQRHERRFTTLIQVQKITRLGFVAGATSSRQFYCTTGRWYGG